MACLKTRKQFNEMGYSHLAFQVRDGLVNELVNYNYSSANKQSVLKVLDGN